MTEKRTPGDGERESSLGLEDWEGASRWPEDDSPVREDQPHEVLPWANVDPGQPSTGP
ncbi:hypothetical protein [Kineococcus sp. SYSU DK004]|uniref:hypothetical protein n=1 Tax=Kineococcus sp. SYSU DK004 TaxID=3383125 RepID=UPI003D7C9011